MNITIKNIDFTYQEIGFFGEKETKSEPVIAHVDYSIVKSNREFETTLDISFIQYKKMNHDDIIQKIKEDIKNVKLS